MKKVISIILLVCTLLAFGLDAQAKTKKRSSSKAKSSVVFKKTSDGWPDIGGHRYQKDDSLMDFREDGNVFYYKIENNPNLPPSKGGGYKETFIPGGGDIKYLGDGWFEEVLYGVSFYWKVSSDGKSIKNQHGAIFYFVK